MDDVYARLFAGLSQPNQEAMGLVRRRSKEVLRPVGALERLDEIAVWLAGWQGTSTPSVAAPAALVFAADHGVAAGGVSAYPSSVTAAMFRALQDGAATASVMAAALGVRLVVVDVGVGRPTGDIREQPALSIHRFGECWETGRVAVSELGTTDLLVLGEMGIGNTTAASAVCAALFGGGAELWTGRGTGVDDATLVRKVAAVDEATRRMAVAGPLETLRQVGGAELVAIAGAAYEARTRSIPVLLDGFVVTSACAALEVAAPGAIAHVFAGHCSAEPGHRLLLEKLGLEPILDLGLRLGEGSGALAALPIVGLAARCVTDVATFEEWGITR
jgi:nicotinate-nucleotide--dimethylbenzimidazole phosphoribosyltransferase